MNVIKAGAALGARLTTTISDHATSAGNAAASYLEKGWQPLALKPQTKAPRAMEWTKRQLRSEDIAAEFPADSNIGLRCGEVSGGLLDVDIDDEVAIRHFAQWLPQTAMRHSRESTGCSHYWYIVTDGGFETQQFRDPVSAAMLIEMRGDGAQTMVPPSVHPCGERVSWVGALEPARLTRAVLSDAVRRVAAATLLARHWPAQGSRNTAALALGGALLRANMDSERAAEFVEAVASAAGDEEYEGRGQSVRGSARKLAKGEAVTGFTKLKELVGDKVAETAFKWLREAGAIEANVEWERPALFSETIAPDIPASLLAGHGGAFAKALAECAEVPEAMPLFAVLGAISTAAAGVWSVMPMEGWNEHINLYSAIAMEPGNNKSLVIRRAAKPLDEWETSQKMELEPEIAAARSKRKSEEKHIENKRRKFAKEEDGNLREKLKNEIVELEMALTEVPVLPKLFTNDATPEALANKVAEQGGKFAIISDEGGILETLAGLYTNGSANVDILLKGFDAGAIRVERRDRSYDLHPILNILLTIQPRILTNMAERKAFQGNGLLERFLFILPQSRLGFRTTLGPTVPHDIESAYGEMIKPILAARCDPNRRGSSILFLSSAARMMWQEFRREIEPQMRPEGSLRISSGWASKLPGITLRIAALIHLANGGVTREQIEQASMEAAIKIARLLIEHRFAWLEATGSDVATEDARHLYDWILREGLVAFSRTDCVRAVRGRIKDRKRLGEALQVLVDRKIVARREAEATGRVGRRAELFDVNPQVFDRKG